MRRFTYRHCVAIWLAAGVLLFTALVGTSHARSRPTFAQAHTAAHLVLDTYAQLVDGHLVVGPCRKAGGFSTTCRGRIDGPSPARYRIVITGTPSGGYIVWARAR